MSNRTFLKIIEELGWPNIYLVSPRQFEHLEGDKIKGYCGIAAIKYPAITISKGLRGRVLANTIYHELAHKLFPYRPHWWIECYAEKMAGGGGRGEYSKKYNHTIDDLPSRKELLKISIEASNRFNSI